MREADVHRVEYLVEAIVDADDLQVLKVGDSSLYLLVRLERLKERPVAIGCQFELAVVLEHDLSIRVKCGQHLLGEKDKVGLLPSEEGIVLEELHCLVMILLACHDKHGACEALWWDNRDGGAVFKLCGVWGELVCIHLCLVEALGEDLEERLVAWKSDVEFALGTIESETATLTSGKNHYTNLTVLDQLLTNGA